MRVLAAPFAVRRDKYNEVQPDVLVARYADLTEQGLPRAPLLAVEVISPTSRLRDASLKKAVYARLGTPSYSLVDPDPDKPSLTVFELADGGYRELAHVTGGAGLDGQPAVPGPRRAGGPGAGTAALIAGAHRLGVCCSSMTPGPGR
ncbi:MAG: Uma2 family endonuclease [Streptosporangiaceae bacterium]